MDKATLMEDLVAGYKAKHQQSEKIFNRASHYQIKGGSHNLRLFDPFPFYISSCSGSRIKDIDGNTYVDFWQGHFANVLGHNPRFVLDALRDYFQSGRGLATGFPEAHQGELAALILEQIRAEKIRFTTSGTLGTMYAIMLAKAFTQRELVMKVGGGWHGSHPYALKGISSYEQGLDQIESAGLPAGMDSTILVSRFNDQEDLEQKFRDYGDQIACFIIEPFIGAGGFIFATKEYLQRARELTLNNHSLLIFDEVVSGFRFHPGGVQTLYGIKPDLTVLGKAIGGGMPLSAVAGREDVIKLCGPEAKADKRVKFEGGTFSAHPASILAGITSIQYYIEHAPDIYPRIGRLGEKVRTAVEEIFSAHGFQVNCTGGGNAIAEPSSLVGVQFLRGSANRLSSPEEVWNPEVCDVEMREKIFKLAMLEEGFNVFHGYGAISSSHTDEEIQASLDAVERIAQRWGKYNIPRG
jgi:glutamate-1-semialdehyde 2,1-aminomutase